MRPLFLLLISLLFTTGIGAQPADSTSLRWFRDAKCGLFLHWGLYSQTAGDWKGHPAEGGEHFMLYERIPLKEYAKIGLEFNPTRYDARQWAKTAKKMGAKYVIITSKHHDGFAMYDSKCSDYNIVKGTPYAKDPMKELVKACRKEGLKFGFYYSLGRDWEDPDVPTNWPTKAGRSNTWDYPDEDAKDLQAYVDRKVMPQLTELLTQYGEIDFLWFDTPELITRAQSQAIRHLIHRLQPRCLINQRIGNGMGDYSIVEQRLSGNINRKPWEACLTMGQNWCYNRHDTVYKDPDIVIRHLTDIVSKGGNLLLNIGPDGLGRFPEQTKPIIEALDRWLKQNGEAIYATRPWHIYGENIDPDSREEKSDKAFHDAVYDGTPKERIPDIRYTCREKTVYAIVRNVPASAYLLRAFPAGTPIRSIRVVGEKRKVAWNLSPDGLSIHIDKPIDTFPIYVLKIEMQ